LLNIRKSRKKRWHHLPSGNKKISPLKYYSKLFENITSPH
jgi:hypothetical protein